MAKIRIVGDSMTITSDLTVKQLKEIMAYHPETPILYDGPEGGLFGKENPKQIFEIMINLNGTGGLTDSAIEYNGEDKDGFAYVTLIERRKATEEKNQEYLALKYAKAVSMLTALENQMIQHIPDIQDQIKKAKEVFASEDACTCDDEEPNGEWPKMPADTEDGNDAESTEE